jgi:hypothetical protein
MTGTLHRTPLLVLILAASPVASQEQASVDPEAAAALARMSTAMRALSHVSLHADVSTEEVLTTGQKLQYGGTIDIMVRRPDRLRVSMTSDRQAREFYYDGENATLFSPRIGYFATFDAPPTTAELLQRAAERYDLELPLVDLVQWGAGGDRPDELKSGFQVGSETIGGKLCDQFAFREEDRDYQIWIARGDEALPCKIVVTTTTDPSMPQFTAVLSWRAVQSFPADTFAFTAPEDSRRIAIGLVPDGAGGSQ